jgi:hypothetical protein
MFTKMSIQRSETQRILDLRSPVIVAEADGCFGASGFAVEVSTSRSKDVYMIGAMQLHDASLGETASLSVLTLARTANVNKA